MPEGYRGRTDKDRHPPLKSHFTRETEKPQQLLWLILVFSDMLSSVSCKRQKATEIIDYGLLWENGEAESGSEWVNLLGWYSTISLSTGRGGSSISYGKSYTEQIEKHILKQTEIAPCCECWNPDEHGRDSEEHALWTRGGDTYSVRASAEVVAPITSSPCAFQRHLDKDFVFPLVLCWQLQFPAFELVNYYIFLSAFSHVLLFWGQYPSPNVATKE